MSDFKFTCPHCQQHLSVDSSMVGTQVACPTCSGTLIVPEPPTSHPRHSLAPTEVGGICPYCRAEIAPTDRTRVCPACHTPHHADCWKENKGCTVFGCSMAPPDEEKIAVTLPSGAQAHRQALTPQPPVSAYRPKTNAPGAVSSLVWGILGFFLCGLILGIVAISNANKAKKLIREQPDTYTGEGLATAGLVIGIIDLVAWALILIANIANAGV